mmetsp:Transcript_67382/g.195131  ORF Transcript_67382/g.195131 Transcript_67382/m.195131 type:complete len:200 (-) Transcript_67382:1257-1856(-)
MQPAVGLVEELLAGGAQLEKPVVDPAAHVVNLALVQAPQAELELLLPLRRRTQHRPQHPLAGAPEPRPRHFVGRVPHLGQQRPQSGQHQVLELTELHRTAPGDARDPQGQLRAFLFETAGVGDVAHHGIERVQHLGVPIFLADASNAGVPQEHFLERLRYVLAAEDALGALVPPRAVTFAAGAFLVGVAHARGVATIRA